MKVVGTHSGGLFLFQLRSPKCNQIKGLAKFDRQLAVADARNIAEMMADFASLLMVLLRSGDADKSPVLHRPLCALFRPAEVTWNGWS